MSAATAEMWPGSVAPVVAEDEGPGAEIKRRRLALGMEIQDLADEAKVDRGRLSAWEKGAPARDSSIAQVLRTLDRLEEKFSGPYDKEANVVTFRLRGNFGVDVTLAGPVDNLGELEASVTRLIRQMGDQSVTPKDTDGV